MRIVVVEPNKEPYAKEIKNTLEEMQGIVGGYIECVNVGKNLVVTCNEEGKLQNLPYNRKLGDYDYLCGTFFITAYKANGDSRSLSDKEVDIATDMFKLTELTIEL